MDGEGGGRDEHMAEALVEGSWCASRSVGEFQAENPATGELLPERYPVSSRDEMLAALRAGRKAAEALRTTNAAAIGDFIEAYARASRPSARVWWI